MTVKSNDLLKIDEFTKKLINMGVYFLYRLDHKDYTYLLKTESISYFLSSDGEIKSKQSSEESTSSIEKIETVYFSDIEFPPSTNVVKVA